MKALSPELPHGDQRCISFYTLPHAALKKGMSTFLLLFPVLLLIFSPFLSAGQDGPAVASLSQARSSHAATSVGHRGFFAGGFNSSKYCFGVACNASTSNMVDIYDASSGNWTTAALSQNRFLLAATSVGDLALFGGGANNVNSTLLVTVEIYNASSGGWTTTSLSQPRAQLAATSVGNLAFFAGGIMNGSSFPSAVVDIYNSSSNTWTTATLSQARYGMAATSMADQVILFTPGSQLNGMVQDIYATCSPFPPQSCPPLPHPRQRPSSARRLRHIRV